MVSSIDSKFRPSVLNLSSTTCQLFDPRQVSLLLLTLVSSSVKEDDKAATASYAYMEDKRDNSWNVFSQSRNWVLYILVIMKQTVKLAKPFSKPILPPYNLFVHSFSLQTFTAFPLWTRCGIYKDKIVAHEKSTLTVNGREIKRGLQYTVIST